MDVKQMSTEELMALKQAMKGSVMSPSVQPLQGDRSKVREANIGYFPPAIATDLFVAKTFKGDDDDAVANVLAKSLNTEVLYDMNPETGMLVPYVMYQGQPYYINRPGFSLGDAENLVGNMIGMAPAGRLAMGGKTLAGQAVRAGAGAGATSIAGDMAVDRMGGGTGVDLPKAATNAVMAPIAQVVGSKLFPMLNNRPLIDTFGNLTPDGIKAMQKAGLDPNMFTREGLARINEFYKKLGPGFEGDAVKALAAKAQAEQFDIPTTLGQQTGDVRQIAREQAMRNYARGQGAGDRMAAFDAQQRTAVQEAAQRETGRLSGSTAPAFATEYEGGAAMMQNIRRAANELDTQIGSAYDEVRKRSLEFKGVSINDLKSQVESAVNAADIPLKAELTPATIAAIEKVQGIKNAVKQSGTTPGLPKWSKTVFEDVDFRDLDTARRQLNQLLNTSKNPTDKRGVTVAIQALDSWIDDAVQRGLAQGDVDAVKALREARALRTKYGNQFEERSWDADAGRVMDRIINTDVTPNEVANLLIGHSDAGQAPVSTRLAVRLKQVFGSDSPEWNQVRELAFMRIVNGPKGSPGGPQAMVTRFNNALQGKGDSFMREVFSPSELQRMRQFRDAVEKLVPPRGATNPSGTGYEVSRMFEDFAAKLLGVKAMTSADPAAAAGAMGAKAGRAVLNSAAASKAAAGMPTPPGRGYAVAPGVAAAAGDESRRRLREQQSDQR